MSTEVSPVELCKGWETSCSFCNKRFSDWEDTEDEEFLQKIPDTSAAYMFAFVSKQSKEVVVIGYHATKARKAISQKLDSLRQRVSQKKFKETKLSIMVRWADFPEQNSKDACTVFAHWYNYSIIPRLTTEWPGENILKSTEHYQFSTFNGKWCHNVKEAVWRKPKSGNPTRAIKKCMWVGSCTFCDNRFSPMVSASECIQKDLAPDSPGIALWLIKAGKKTQTIYTNNCTSLQKNIKSTSSWIKHVLSQKGYSSSMDDFFVRWMVQEDDRSDESCLIYAHFQNAEERPLIHQDKFYGSKPFVGEKELTENKNFSFRERDSQWCYTGESKIKPVRYNKIKEKRILQQSIEEELLAET